MKTKYTKRDFNRINIKIGDKTHGNLQNKTVEEQKDKKIYVFQYLHEEYGIIVGLQHLDFNEMKLHIRYAV